MTTTETLPDFMQWREVSSLVGSLRTRSLVARPTTLEQCREAIEYCRRRHMTICARGSGRGYGDLALNSGHAILDMSRMNRILDFDEEKAQITVESGTRLIEIYELVHHKLLFLPASPTESHSSVAGAICANVNGKEGWHNGSFAHQVISMKMLCADGTLRTIERGDELFGAVVGGIGLLGVIVEATLQLKRIPSCYVEINRTPAANVDELLELMAQVEQTHDAAVIWVDAYARGKAIGRSVVHAAKWVERDDPEPARRAALRHGFARLDRHRRFGLALHETFGPLISLLLHFQRPAVNGFNKLYYRMCQLAARTGRASNSELFLRFNFEASFTVPPAHLVCGPRGYTVQLTFPRSCAREAMVELLEICQSSPCPPVTTVMRAHKRDDCLISFSEDGYSLNFEFHPKGRHEAASRAAVDRLIDATARRGGKVHLAKDQVLTPEQFVRIFPRARDLLAIKRRLDPEGMFTSDLARRVGIDRLAPEPPEVQVVRSNRAAPTLAAETDPSRS
ncbi:MAG: FAD-binding oxidoreductase [Phycisphaerales bacterium JB039]